MHLRLLIAKIVFMGHSFVVFQNTNVMLEFSVYVIKVYNVLYFMSQKNLPKGNRQYIDT